MNHHLDSLLKIIPQALKKDVEMYGTELLEIRLRDGYHAELVTMNGSVWLSKVAAQEDISYIVNKASDYSPWMTHFASGFVTAQGGHRVGLAGMAGATGFQKIHSVNIRVCRDIPNVSLGIEPGGNVLIIGPPGCGKSTLLRDLTRRASSTRSVCVVDERSELFPIGFSRGSKMDVLMGFGKSQGIDMALRTMGPSLIAVDEITAKEDCDALLNALWCGVEIMATAHAHSVEDLVGRKVYRPLLQNGLFDRVIVMRRDKSWKEAGADCLQK